ncbi:putative licABCH operon regulator [Streptococcus constellatus]|uniref:Putative licABCH operon regulator n=1 Tax=Streptococcus constellatus TaxID=76860 RepID=A0A564TPJ2_STRCV|nr:HTH domain-containing protein [Streptococcus constellatus]VUX02276.1 putative licABCH operon regulator [Streptococcus gordonii]VUX09162.1 putative licABCH operon regulator [Streptococcus constellatus]
MKNKEKQLLNILLTSNSEVTSKYLGQELKVSSRSVKNYIKSINETYGQSIILSSNKGYKLNQRNSAILLLDQESGEIPDTYQERADYILKLLISSSNLSADLFDVAEDLYISFSTLKNTIFQMWRDFKQFNVFLDIKDNILFLNGDETNKRKLITSVISKETKNKVFDIKSIQEYFIHVNTDKLMNILTNTFKQNGYYPNIFTFKNLLTHLSLIIERNFTGNSLSETTIIETSSPQKIDKLTNICIEKIENEFQINFNKYELDEIYLLFKLNLNMNNGDLDIETLVDNEIL